MNPQLVDFIKGWEELRLEAYLDGGGVPTIGYGHTRGVHIGDTCSVEKAEHWLMEEIQAHADGLYRYLYRTPTLRQFDALVSLGYNCGIAPPKGIGRSGLMTLFNAGRDLECANQFRLWNKDNGKVVAGLVKRREAERAIYLNADYSGRP